MSFLYGRKDFADLIQQAAEQRSIQNPAIVEKDYFVTEALRVLAREFGDVAIFKGGTGLSKGWGLIDRFSEGIDLCYGLYPDFEEILAGFKEIRSQLRIQI